MSIKGLGDFVEILIMDVVSFAQAVRSWLRSYS